MDHKDPLELSQELILRALRQGWAVRYVNNKVEFFRDRQSLTPYEQKLLREGQFTQHFLNNVEQPPPT